MSFAEANAQLGAAGSAFEVVDVEIRGVKSAAWKHALPTLRDAFLAGRRHGESEFLIYKSERVSYDAFTRAAAAFARTLVARGVRKGDRVAIIMRNLPEWPVAFFGATLAGAIVAPLNAWWVGSELEYALVDSGAKVAIMDSERCDRLGPHLGACTALECTFVARPAGALATSMTPLEAVIGDLPSWRLLPDATLPEVSIHTDEDACILFTSGTTGAPKGALATHRNIMSAVLGGNCTSARNSLRHRGELPPTGAPRRLAVLLSVPLFHASGCFLQLLPVLINGGKLVLMRKWNVEQALSLIERERITHAGGVPAVAHELASHPARREHDLSSIEALSWGGAPSPPELVHKVNETLERSAAGSGWGMTETSGLVTHHAGHDYERHPDSAGVVLPAWQIKIVDAEGRRLAAGEVGELWAKGPGVIRGYWNKPEATAETFVDGWVKTGDLARIDAEGCLFIVDRKKDMLIRGGENIYCVEIENALYEHPDVIDAAIVPIAHDILGELPGAVLHLREGATIGQDELRAFAAQRLAAYKIPVHFAFMPQPLPRNPSGKILKRELREIFSSTVSSARTKEARVPQDDKVP